MELGAHDVVTMSGDDVDAGSALIIPDAHGLIVAGGEDPREFMVEEGGSDIVDMSFESEHASFLLIIPHFDQAVVTPRNE